MEKKKYIVEEIGVAGWGARLEVLEGKYQGIEIASLCVTPGEYAKKDRTITDAVRLAYGENKKIVIAIYEDIPK